MDLGLRGRRVLITGGSRGIGFAVAQALAAEGAAVGHHHMQRPGHVVLEVRRLAQVGARQRLDVVRPAPSGLQREPADLGAADLEQVQGAVVEGTGLVGHREALLFCFPAHGVSFP